MPANEVIMTCIRGEEWPTRSFQSYIITTDDPLTGKSVTFICPANHSFTLKQALSRGILTAEQAKNILTHAQKTKEEAERRKVSAWQASDFMPDKEVAAFNIPCVYCGKKPAEWSEAKPLENEAECKNTALCLDCRAAWHNYNARESLDLWGRTHGRPTKIFWMAVFERFVKRLPPLNFSESEKLLNECRKRAKTKK